MGKRQKEWGKKKRQELIESLGGRCVLCPPEKRNRKLEIDHVNGRDYDVTKLGSDTRTSRYLKEHRSGVPLRVLCKYHNGQQGAMSAKSNAPF